ncbi:MAG: energy transducer TonB [Deltaproteobacteria bacterium]|nr:energy transducer TonB [Deltaproteobacteria bacterium]
MLGILSNRNRRILASCLGTLLLFILLLLASLEGKFEVERPTKIRMHEVRIYKPPPPPPPPPVEQNTTDSPMPSLTKGNAEDPVKLDVMALEVNMDDAIGVSGFGTGGPGGGGGLGWGGGEWGTVVLSELDGIPMVRSAPLLYYPQEAVDQNILEFKVMLHIVIDEEGRAYPVRIVQNPFPSMNDEILEFVSAVRFTPPTRLGVPVKTEYLWPLLMALKRP